MSRLMKSHRGMGWEGKGGRQILPTGCPLMVHVLEGGCPPSLGHFWPSGASDKEKLVNVAGRDTGRNVSRRVKNAFMRFPGTASEHGAFS